MNAVDVTFRILDDLAIVPSSMGRGCYHVNIEDGVAVHCSCPDHQRRARACKHMGVVDAALRGEAEQVKGRDAFRATLAPKAAPRTKAKAKKTEAPRTASGFYMDPNDPRWFNW